MSQNPDDYGWAGDCCRTDHLRPFTVGGSTFQVNRRAYDNLHLFVTRFDTEVERVALDGWDGGYACRDVRGYPGVKSIHSWGLAIDLNATRHPLGRAGTFSTSKLAALRHLLADFPEIAWGGDYSQRKDEQHFQICKPPEVCAALAAARAKPKPPPTPRPRPFPLPVGHWFGVESPDPRNHSGLTKADAASIQRIRGRLALPAGNRYDKAVARRVTEFQRLHKITVDGKVGPQTWAALRIT
jgi:hypothetical protein